MTFCPDKRRIQKAAWRGICWGKIYRFSEHTNTKTPSDSPTAYAVGFPEGVLIIQQAVSKAIQRFLH